MAHSERALWFHAERWRVFSERISVLELVATEPLYLETFEGVLKPRDRRFFSVTTSVSPPPGIGYEVVKFLNVMIIWEKTNRRKRRPERSGRPP